jgi:thiol-disulfide isomerase/thioredoxin
VNQLFSRLHPSGESRLPGFGGATAWLNAGPLTAADVDGKVVAVQFWTYTCINWLRTLPYVRAWATAYGRHGLVVVGVHTPEFDVEHDLDNVRRAVQAMGIEYAVAVDNDYAVWDAFANHYWPALYIADAHGRIRHHHFGEGGYEESERAIHHLLTDAGAEGLPDAPTPVEPHGIELAADWADLRSPETYVGLDRSDSFASPGTAVLGQPHVYAAPARLAVNEWALTGTWTFHAEDARCDEPGGRIAYRFHARDVNLILVPPADHGTARFRVLLDGQPPGDAHGVDTDEAGNGTVDEPRLYQLVRQSGAVTDRQVDIELLDPGARALCFTFG